MTKRLDEAIARLRELPDKIQNAVADALFANLETYAENDADREIDA